MQIKKHLLEQLDNKLGAIYSGGPKWMCASVPCVFLVCPAILPSYIIHWPPLTTAACLAELSHGTVHWLSYLLTRLIVKVFLKTRIFWQTEELELNFQTYIWRSNWLNSAWWKGWSQITLHLPTCICKSWPEEKNSSFISKNMLSL